MKQYIKNILIAISQLFNSILFGHPDETIAARSYRKSYEGNIIFIIICLIIISRTGISRMIIYSINLRYYSIIMSGTRIHSSNSTSISIIICVITTKIVTQIIISTLPERRIIYIMINIIMMEQLSIIRIRCYIIRIIIIYNT